VLRVRARSRPRGDRNPRKGWEAALTLRLRHLPRPRAPARLRRRIFAALAALDKELKAAEKARAGG